MLEHQKLNIREIKILLRKEAKESLNRWPDSGLRTSKRFKIREFARSGNDIINISRKDCAAIIALITGQNQLAGRAYAMYPNQGISNFCRFCNQEVEDSIHIVEECDHFNGQRFQVFGAPKINLNNLDLDIQRIKSFIDKAGIREHLLKYDKNSNQFS